MTAPWTFAEARNNCALASHRQYTAELAARRAARDAATAEEAYRVALAQEIIRQHDDDKVAWTVAPDLARGNARVAELKRLRDIAEGVRDATSQLSWRRNADRKDAQRFADWSMRRELAENGGPDTRLGLAA